MERTKTEVLQWLINEERKPSVFILFNLFSVFLVNFEWTDSLAFKIGSMMLESEPPGPAEDLLLPISSDPICQAMTLILYILIEILGNFLIYSLMWFERIGSNVQQRNLINRMIFQVEGCIIFNNVLIVNIDFFRFFLGWQYSDSFCVMRSFSSKFIYVLGFFWANEIVGVRYVYHCVWRSVKVVNDDFFLTFFMVGNLVVAGFFVLIDMFVWGRNQEVYTICMGKQEQDFYLNGLSKDQSPLNLLPIISAAWYLFVFSQMYVENLRVDQSSSPYDLEKNPCLGWTQRVCHRLKLRNMGNFGQGVLIMIMYLLSLVPLGVFFAEDNLQSYIEGIPHRYGLVFAYFLPMLFITTLMPIFYIYKNDVARTTVLRKILDDWRDLYQK